MAPCLFCMLLSNDIIWYGIVPCHLLLLHDIIIKNVANQATTPTRSYQYNFSCNCCCCHCNTLEIVNPHPAHDVPAGSIISSIPPIPADAKILAINNDTKIANSIISWKVMCKLTFHLPKKLTLLSSLVFPKTAASDHTSSLVSWIKENSA